MGVGGGHEEWDDILAQEDFLSWSYMLRVRQGRLACRINLRKRILMFCGGVASRPVVVGGRQVGGAGGGAARNDVV